MHKCYYTYDKKTSKKVLIPECWSVVISNEIECCTCTNNSPTYSRKVYNDQVNRLNRIIDSLHNQVIDMIGQLEKVNEKLKS